MSHTILIVEDEPSIADNIMFALRTEGFGTIWTQLGQEGIACVKEQRVDLVIVDVGLPDLGGFEVCKAIRAFSEVPIVFLTARSEEIDRVVGLEIGADDYVVKPFSPRELVARVKAILKRAKPGSRLASLDAQGLFQIDEDKAQIKYCDHPLALTRYEFLLLRTLLSHPERVYSRAQLMELAWESPESSLERTVDAHIKSLRAKLRAVRSDLDPIQTHRGFGYSVSG